MSHRLEGVEGGDSVRTAAERMTTLEVGALPVFEGGRVVGMVTDRDLVVRVLARGLDGATPVHVAMTHGIVVCFADEDVSVAASTMARERVRRLIVVDRELSPVGVLSVDDLALHGCDPGLVAEVTSGGATETRG
ncbi:MAG TPA: CBS domain-containing protein [Polyangia bacterium]